MTSRINSHPVKPRRAMLQAQVRENHVVQLRSSADEHQQIPLVRITKRGGNSRLNLRRNANFNHENFAVRIVGIVVRRRSRYALTAHAADFVFAQIANNQRGDDAFAIDQRIHDEKRDAIFRRQQCADDAHDLPLVITESEAGLGLKNEINIPGTDEQMVPIDYRNLSGSHVTVQLDKGGN